MAIFFEILDIRKKDPKKIAFCHVDQTIRNALEATGILSFCQVFTTEKEALEMLK